MQQRLWAARQTVGNVGGMQGSSARLIPAQRRGMHARLGSLGTLMEQQQARQGPGDHHAAFHYTRASARRGGFRDAWVSEPRGVYRNSGTSSTLGGLRGVGGSSPLD